MLTGVFPLARMVGGGDMNQGEALRYLAELPWFPDAILTNRSLDWTVINSKTIKVATGVDDAPRAQVTFELNDNGIVERVSAPSRLYAENGRMRPLPWHCRLWDYQTLGGRLIPRQGEAAWILDGVEFVYWRGHISSWSGHASNTPIRPTPLSTTTGGLCDGPRFGGNPESRMFARPRDHRPRR